MLQNEGSAFLGSSFAFLGGFSAVAALDTGIFADMTMGEKLPYACGGIVVAGLLYLILALIVKIVGVKKVMRFLPPVVTGPMIILIGLSLAGSAVTNASQNWLLAIVALAIIIIANIWGKGMIKIIPDSSRRCRFLCICADFKCTWRKKSRRICYFNFH